MYKQHFGQGVAYGPSTNGEYEVTARYYEKGDKEFKIWRHSKISNRNSEKATNTDYLYNEIQFGLLLFTNWY
ncbi:MAG: hypothetical protein APF81_02890 [Desulfosporosinus sp. BRH_c37]|nr:MAG: hypothetical protein APF81_02890 [Desulfosporosinus sp. BRH_c37]